MWQNYMDFTTSNATATPEAQEEIDLQQAIRQSLLTDQGEQLPRTESALSTGVTMKPPLPSKRSVPLPQPLTRDEVTEEMIAQLHEPNEATICNMYNRGITRRQLEQMISPKCGTKMKFLIMAAIGGAVQKMEKHKRLKAACYPADQSAPDGSFSRRKDQ